MNTFFDEINLTTNKFEAHANFAKEQALYELKRDDMIKQGKLLDEKLIKLNVSLDRSSSRNSNSRTTNISRASSRQTN